jgi:hypothetical protein
MRDTLQLKYGHVIALTFFTFYKEHQELRKSDKKGKRRKYTLSTKL